LRRLVEGGLQRAFAGHVAPGPAEAAERVRQRTGEQAAQPGQELAVAPAAELVALAVGLQQRLLDHVGGVELGPDVRPELRPRPQQEVLPEALQRQPLSTGFVLHGGPPRGDFPTMTLPHPPGRGKSKNWWNNSFGLAKAWWAARVCGPLRNPGMRCRVPF